MAGEPISYLIINGAPVAKSTLFPSVVRLVSNYKNRSEDDLGSGVIVSENVLITAGHVVAKKKNGDPLKSLKVRYGNNRHDEGTFEFTIKDLSDSSNFKRRIKLHPHYSRECGKNDIAVVKTHKSLLKGDAKLAKVASPMPANALQSTHLAASGWGMVAQNNNWFDPAFLQTAMQHVSGKPVSILSNRGDYYTSGGSGDNQTKLLQDALAADEIYVSDLTGARARIGPCPGDSGGGLFLGASESDTADPGGTAPAHVLIGIVSHAKPTPAPGFDPREHYAKGDLIVACTNVVTHFDFIKNSISGLGGKPATFWS